MNYEDEQIRKDLRYILRRVRRTGRPHAYGDSLVWVHPAAVVAMLQAFKRSGDMKQAIDVYEVTKELLQ